MVASKSATLNPVELQQLVRLYRDGVDGAADQLMAIADSASDELADLLGVPAGSNLTPDAIAAAVAQTRRSVREQRSSEARAHAQALALEVSRHVRRSLESVLLPIQTFAELALTPGYRCLAFSRGDTVLGLDRGFVARFLRECRRAKLELVRVDDVCLTLLYSTATSRGRVRLLLGIVPREETIVVDLDPVVQRHPVMEHVIDEQLVPDEIAATMAVPDHAAPATEVVEEVPELPTPSPLVPAPRPPRRSRRREGFWGHLFDAFREAV